MTEKKKPAAEEIHEIDDKALDQVVGGVGVGGLYDQVAPSKSPTVPKTSSFGGEDWDKTGTGK
jgi:hypothetical protein